MPDQILLYDGTCGFCAETVQFILRHERGRSLKFASLEGRLASDVRIRHPELDGVDSMVWVEGLGTSHEAVAIRSQAVLKAAAYLGRGWAMVQLGRALPSPLRDALYDVVARHRHRIIRQNESCFVPSPKDRERFLD